MCMLGIVLLLGVEKCTCVDQTRCMCIINFKHLVILKFIVKFYVCKAQRRLTRHPTYSPVEPTEDNAQHGEARVTSAVTSAATRAGPTGAGPTRAGPTRATRVGNGWTICIESFVVRSRRSVHSGRHHAASRLEAPILGVEPLPSKGLGVRGKA